MAVSARVRSGPTPAPSGVRGRVARRSVQQGDEHGREGGVGRAQDAVDRDAPQQRGGVVGDQERRDRRGRLLRGDPDPGAEGRRALLGGPALGERPERVQRGGHHRGRRILEQRDERGRGALVSQGPERGHDGDALHGRGPLEAPHERRGGARVSDRAEGVRGLRRGDRRTEGADEVRHRGGADPRERLRRRVPRVGGPQPLHEDPRGALAADRAERGQGGAAILAPPIREVSRERLHRRLVAAPRERLEEGPTDAQILLRVEGLEQGRDGATRLAAPGELPRRGRAHVDLRVAQRDPRRRAHEVARPSARLGRLRGDDDAEQPGSERGEGPESHRRRG